jgi:hypothetical protein
MLRKPFVLVFIRFRARARHHENNLATEDTENTEKKNLCNLRNLWFLLFHCLQGFLSVIKK